MLTIHKMDRKKGLDLILHTPWGDIAATESLMDYLKEMFNGDIRVIVPQICMSAGTMICLWCSEVNMWKQSNLWPIDPQMQWVPCEWIIEEFENAKKDILESPALSSLWETIINKYHPTFIGSCQHAIDWSRTLVEEWLLSWMCKGDLDSSRKVIAVFWSQKKQKSHNRHISRKQCKDAWLNIISLEDIQVLQEAVLTTHHAFMHSFTHSMATKIIENHMWIAYVETSEKK